MAEALPAIFADVDPDRRVLSLLVNSRSTEGVDVAAYLRRRLGDHAALDVTAMFGDERVGAVEAYRLDLTYRDVMALHDAAARLDELPVPVQWGIPDA